MKLAGRLLRGTVKQMIHSEYIIDIHLNGGKGYSTPICDDEWSAFIKAWAGKGSLDGWTVPTEVLEELWVPEYINSCDKVIVRKVK